MRFIDEVSITVESGKGGPGCLSFRREKFIPRGGPDGGDGGKGGDIILSATSHRRTLYRYRFQKYYKAPNGVPGQGKRKSGKNGADLVLEIPPGTLVYDAHSHELIRDFVADGDRMVIAKGGRGGRGNARFKTSTNRTPRFAQPGEPSQALNLRLELKLIADVGIVGLPNAGKSTLISVISAVRPKIADYPFTTLEPHIGVVTYGEGETFVAADIPGLIPGAHTGQGLGIQFLRHTERTRILVHMVDAADIDPQNPLAGYEAVNRELRLFSQSLAAKPQIVVLNKLDLPASSDGAGAFCRAMADREVLLVSAATGKGVNQVVGRIARMLARRLDKEDDDG